MTKKRLQTRQCTTEEEIRQFFEETALEYREAHGDEDKLLQYRMALLIQQARLKQEDVVLDVGCGNGHHLFYIVPSIKYGIGVDFSRNMIESAQKALKTSPHAHKLQFQVDKAQNLTTVAKNSINLVMCVGSFEHMLEKEEVIQQFYRVLKPGGRLLLMTPNGKYFWYRVIAPLFRYDIRHLSTDLFMSASQLTSMLYEGRFSRIHINYWTFIPRGDMSDFWASLLAILDFIGRCTGIARLRGGIIVKADKG